MKKIIIPMLATILLIPLALAKPEWAIKPDKEYILNNNILQQSENLIEDDGLIQFVDTDTNVLLEVRINKLRDNELFPFYEIDNLTKSLKYLDDNTIKFAYEFNFISLNPAYYNYSDHNKGHGNDPTHCDPDNKNYAKCVNKEIEKLKLRIYVNSSLGLVNIGQYAFNVSGHILNYSDLAANGFIVEDKYDAHNINITIYDNWTKYDLYDIISLDPFFQSWTITVTESSSGGGYAGRCPTCLSQSTISSGSNATITEPLQEKQYGWFWLIVIAIIIYKWKEIKKWFK